MGRDGQSVLEKASKVLECFIRDGRSSLGFVDLLEGTQISRASLHRTLGEMAENGILSQDGRREDYRLGPLLRSAAALAGAVSSVPAIARPHMERLRDECEETIVLAELHDVHVVPVERADGLHEMRMNQEVGRRYPAHAGATAKALVAHLPPDERSALLKRLALDELTTATTTDRRELEAELDEVAEVGVAVTLGERVRDAVAISAPVFDADGRVAAALTISGIASRYGQDRLVADAIAVRRVAALISAELGGSRDNGAQPSVDDEALERLCRRAWDAQRART
jgi:DNA-binding IclR family transcriptional regulator